MAAFSRHPLARVVLFTLVSALAVAAQDDSKTFDCKPTIGETKYDLENLASEYELSWENGLPPSVIQDKLTFNLCSALTHKDNVPSDEQVGAHLLCWSAQHHEAHCGCDMFSARLERVHVSSAQVKEKERTPT